MRTVHFTDVQHACLQSPVRKQQCDIASGSDGHLVNHWVLGLDGVHYAHGSLPSALERQWAGKAKVKARSGAL
jgi:hypothetical protein